MHPHEWAAVTDGEITAISMSKIPGENIYVNIASLYCYEKPYKTAFNYEILNNQNLWDFESKEHFIIYWLFLLVTLFKIIKTGTVKHQMTIVIVTCTLYSKVVFHCNS